MGVKIFRDNNWNRIKNGVISREDIMGLDQDRDRGLIGYLIAHASEPCRGSMMKYASGKYGMDEAPESHKNIDDLNDLSYEDYFVLQEQAVQEDNYGLLKEAALHSSNYDIAAFAFCRLTGYRFPPSVCDAYSYRTFSCDILPGMTGESIIEICQSMINERGPLADAAKECLMNWNDSNSSGDIE